MKKLPYLTIYPGDLLKDPGVQALTNEEFGIWVKIIFIMHDSNPRGKLILNGKRITNERLANSLKLTPEKTKTVTDTLKELGVAGVDPKTGALICRRMIADEKLRKLKAKAGKFGGGNPALKSPKKPLIKPNDQSKPIIDKVLEKEKCLNTIQTEPQTDSKQTPKQKEGIPLSLPLSSSIKKHLKSPIPPKDPELDIPNEKNLTTCNSKVIQAFLKSGKTRTEARELLKNAVPLNDYERELLERGEILFDIRQNLFLMFKALLGEKRFDSLLAEAKGDALEGRRPKKNPTARLIFRLIQALENRNWG